MPGKENTMTIHIQMLYEVAKSAKAMADAMQAIVDDCAEQLAQRKAAGESDAAMLNEVFGGVQQPLAGMIPSDEPTPFDEPPAAPEKPKTVLSAPKAPDFRTGDRVAHKAFVAERSTPENRTKIKAILTKYGVKKLTELPEEKYEAVRNEVAAL